MGRNINLISYIFGRLPNSSFVSFSIITLLVFEILPLRCYNIYRYTKKKRDVLFIIDYINESYRAVELLRFQGLRFNGDMWC